LDSVSLGAADVVVAVAVVVVVAVVLVAVAPNICGAGLGSWL